MSNDLIRCIDGFADTVEEALCLTGSSKILACIHPHFCASGSRRIKLASGRSVTYVVEGTLDEGAIEAKNHEEDIIYFRNVSDHITVSPYDACVLAWDYNWFTVTSCLEAYHDATLRHGKPFLAFVYGSGWPTNYRDMYRMPATIPQTNRHPSVFRWSPLGPTGTSIALAAEDDGKGAFAVCSGGPRNGVMSALKDFVGNKPLLRLHTLDAMGGLSVVYSSDAAWANKIELALNRQPMSMLAITEEDRIRLLLAAASWEQRCRLTEENYHGLVRKITEGGIVNMSTIPGQFFPWQGPAPVYAEQPSLQDNSTKRRGDD